MGQTHETATLGLWADEVHESNVQCSWNDQDKEELPANLFKRNGPCDEQNDICEVQPRHSDTHTLTSNMSWEDLRPSAQVRIEHLIMLT